MNEDIVTKKDCVDILNEQAEMTLMEASYICDYFEKHGIYWLLYEFICTQLEEDGSDAFKTLAAELIDNGNTQ
jgi:hypothetical protein